MRIKPRSTLHKNINELRVQGYEVYADNQPVPDNIPNPETKRDTPTLKTWGWGVIDCRKQAEYCYMRAIISGFGEESLKGLT